MKKIILKSVQALINEQIALNELHLANHNAVRDLLATVEGKPINKVTFNAKRLGDDFKFITDRCGSPEIFYNGTKHNLTQRMKYDYISLADFDAADSAYGKGAKDRIAQLKALDVEEVTRKFAAIQKHLYAILDIFSSTDFYKVENHKNPVYYQLFNMILDSDKTDCQPHQLYWMAKEYKHQQKTVKK